MRFQDFAPKQRGVKQTLLLDAALLTFVFLLNLKCARQLSGVLSPDCLTRLFVWI